MSMGTPTESTTPSGNGARPMGALERAAAAQAARNDERAAFLAEDAVAADVTPDATGAEPDAAADAAPAAEEADTGAEPDAAADAEPAKAPAVKVDPETAKRLATVQAAEKRSREKLAKERAEFEAERAAAAKEREALAADRAALDEFRKLRERAKVDPVAALEALGIDDPEYAAKQLYAKAKGDPANKEAAARLLRERERDERLAEVEKRLAERDKTEKEQAAYRAAHDAAIKFMAQVEKTANAGADAPLAKHFLAKNPRKAKQQLGAIAIALYDETGDEPDVADVLARYEAMRRAELEDDGVSIDSILTTEAKKPDQPAAKKPAATLDNTMSTPRVPRTLTDEREQRAAARDAFIRGAD